MLPGRRLRVAVLAIGWLYSACAPAGPGDASRPHISISVEGDRLTARIERASLRRVLAELDRRAGLRSEFIQFGDDDTVSAIFDAVPLEEVLRSLLGGRSFVMVRDTGATAGPAPLQVVIFPRPAVPPPSAEAPGATQSGASLDDLAQAMVDPDERVRARAALMFEDALARDADPPAAGTPRPRR